MRAAAELARVVTDLDDAHPVAVLLAEHRDGAEPAGLVLVGDEPAHLEIAQQHLVDLVLDVAEHAVRHRRRRGEVEPQPARRIERTGLRSRVTERAPQPRVQQVGRRVPARHRRPPLEVDPGQHHVARTHLAGQHGRAVRDQAGQRLLDVDDRELRLATARVDREPPPVGELAAALGVERGRVENDLDLVTLVRRGQQPVAADQRGDRRLAGDLGVAGELSTARSPAPAVQRQVQVAGLLLLRVGLRPGALLGHQPAEPRLVDLDALLGRHLEGEVDREAVGVVQLERLVAGQLTRCPPLRVGHRDVEDRRPGPQRLPERVLLA